MGLVFCGRGVVCCLCKNGVSVWRWGLGGEVGLSDFGGVRGFCRCFGDVKGE